jgi:hypothetical protein
MSGGGDHLGRRLGKAAKEPLQMTNIVILIINLARFDGPPDLLLDDLTP